MLAHNINRVRAIGLPQKKKRPSTSASVQSRVRYEDRRTDGQTVLRAKEPSMPRLVAFRASEPSDFHDRVLLRTLPQIRTSGVVCRCGSSPPSSMFRQSPDFLRALAECRSATLQARLDLAPHCQCPRGFVRTSSLEGLN